MKEAFWGVLIIVLGLFGIVVVNVFQNITVDNDRVYYAIKESTEAAAFDAIDLTYYRLNGTIRIVEDKFVENLTRRFAENVTKNSYKIVVEDINEMPPKISLRVETGVGIINTGMFSQDDPFNIVNRVDAIFETKYTVEDLEFIGVTREEWEEKEETDPIEKICKPTVGAVDEGCIDGDLKFVGYDDLDIANKICKGQRPPSNLERKVKYQVCECGKWVDKTEILVANPELKGNEWSYEWKLYVEGENRVINQIIREIVLQVQCTDGIQIYVPDDIDEKNQNSKDDKGNKIKLPYQPSSDNSRYEICPPGGIKIPIGMSFIAHPNYIPKDSVNRYLIWSSSNKDVLGVVGKNPSEYCDLNDKYSNCLSTATITTKSLGVSYINVETTELLRNSKGERVSRGQKATCKVEVYDGKIPSDGSIDCEDLTLEVGASAEIKALPNPKNITIYNYTYEIGNSGVATLSGKKVTGVAGGSTEVTITETITGKSGKCTVKVAAPPIPAGVPYADDTGGGTYEGEVRYEIRDQAGNFISSTTSYANAKAAAEEYSSNNGGIVSLSSINPTDGRKILLNKTHAVGDKIFTHTYNGMAYSIASDSKSNPKAPSANPYDDSADNGGYSGGGGGGGSKPNVSSGGWTPTTNSGQGGGAGCLPLDSKILTESGYKDISKINVGEKVLSYNILTKENEFKEVKMVYKHKNMYDVLYTFVVNNKKIKATRLHEFYVKTLNGYNFIKAEDLKIGDLLMGADGNYYSIRRISSEYKFSTYYDLSVKDNHNYYVGKDNILVHNAISKR